MNNLQEVFERALEIEKMEPGTRGPLQTTENITLKLMEELGEVAAAVLKLNKYKVTKESIQDISDNLDEEVVDMMIMAFTLAHKRNLTIDKLLPIFERKMEKWLKIHVLKTA